MNTAQAKNRNFEAVAWGLLFVWWGVVELFQALPAGSAALGIGLILLGVNAARALSGIPTVRFSTALGILALVWGGLEIVGAVLDLPFELPVFAILLIILGVLLLGRVILQETQTNS